MDLSSFLLNERSWVILFLGNDVAVFIDGELDLAAHGVDFRLLDLSDGVDGEKDAVA